MSISVAAKSWNIYLALLAVGKSLLGTHSVAATGTMLLFGLLRLLYLSLPLQRH